MPIKNTHSFNFKHLMMDVIFITQDNFTLMELSSFTSPVPTHGNRIPYLELSQMWNSWLNNKVNYKNEIIISSAKNRNKDITNYLKLLEKSMVEMVRVLKPNRCLSLMFNTHSERTWQEIFDFTKNIGLKIHDISTLNYSRNSVVQEHKEGGLRFDFVLTFKKTKSS